MGKKKIAETKEDKPVVETKAKSVSKKKLDAAILYVQSTYNNTKVVLTDVKGNTIAWTSAGAQGFKGAKKGTPFAAAKLGEVIGDKAKELGVKEVAIVVNGVGAGRESAIRSFMAKGASIVSIKDVTPVPHNGPKPPKPRRV